MIVRPTRWWLASCLHVRIRSYVLSSYPGGARGGEGGGEATHCRRVEPPRPPQVMLCDAVLCCAMPWNAMPCHAMPCHTVRLDLLALVRDRSYLPTAPCDCSTVLLVSFPPSGALCLILYTWHGPLLRSIIDGGCDSGWQVVALIAHATYDDGCSPYCTSAHATYDDGCHPYCKYDCTVPRHASPRHAAARRAALPCFCRAAPCRSFGSIPCRAAPRRATPRRAVPCYAIPCQPIRTPYFPTRGDQRGTFGGVARGARGLQCACTYY